MANIDAELIVISEGRYGKDVRKAIHDGMEKTNNESETSRETVATFDDRVSALENKPAASMLLESTSPLEYATNNNIVGLYAEGKSEQYISKNKCFTDAKTSTQGGITFTKKDDGIWNVNGTYSTTTFFNLNTELFVLEANTTYTMSGAINSGCRLRIRGWSDEAFTSQILDEKYDAGSGVTFTTPNQKCYCRVQIVVYATQNNSVIKPMMNEGSTALPYEPYTGTPSPTNIIPPINASGVVEAHTKNLFDKNNTSMQLNNVYIATDGTASSGENNYAIILKCEPNTNYTFRSPHLVSNNSRVALYTDIPKVGSKGTVILTLPTNSVYEGTVNSGNNNYILFAFNHSGIGYQTFINDLQIEYGTTASPYVEYKSNAINIEGNLFNPTNVLHSQFSSGKIVATEVCRIAFTEVEPNTTYVVSKKKGTFFRVASTSVLPTNGVDVFSVVDNYTAESIVYTTPSNARYIVSAIWYSILDTTISADEMIASVQIERGSVPTPYQPYTADHIILRSIPNTNIADTLTVNEDGSAEWVQKVGVKNLSSLNWNLFGEYAGHHLFYWDRLEDAKYSDGWRNISLCNAYVTVPNDYLEIMKDHELRIRASDGKIYLNDDRYADATSFNNWIHSQNVILYYELATPIVHTLTKEQVDAIRQLKTYEGTTLIDSELANVTIKYAGDTKKYIDEKDNELRDYADDKDTAILELAISEAMLYTQNMVKGLKEYTPTEEYVGTFLGEDLYRRVFKGNVTSNATTSNGQEVTWLNQKVVKMIDGHVGMYPLQRYVESNDYLRVDWFSRMMDSDYHTIPIINIHCSSGYVGLGYEIVVYYTKPYEYGTMTPPEPIVTSLDDEAEVKPMSEEAEDE